MLIALVLVFAVLQGAQPGSSTLATRAVDAIDGNYLYAETTLWQYLRATLLADNKVPRSFLEQQLAALHDGDLRIVTRHAVSRRLIYRQSVEFNPRLLTNVQ